MMKLLLPLFLVILSCGISQAVEKKLNVLMAIVAVAHAELTLTMPFGDHAVLQHGKPLPVWGKAEPSAIVTVKLGNNS